MKTKTFAIRNAKEILRDPLSYIFCIGFPLIMMVIMTVVNESIPKEASLDIFNIYNLIPGIMVFGLTFIMQFMTILVSKDRCTMFIERLKRAPINGAQLMLGYLAPVVVIGILQALVAIIVGLLTAVLIGDEISIMGPVMSIVFSFPIIIMFSALGIILGCLFNDKVAPGVSSIIITVAGLLGGIWMDVEVLGGAIFAVSKALPFYWATEAGRSAVLENYGDAAVCCFNPAIYCIFALVISTFVLKKVFSAR